ncbi:MAG: lamin tail domain-containing protein [Myxococcota bacterium]
MLAALLFIGCDAVTAGPAGGDAAAPAGAEAPLLVINEFLAVNQSTITDDGGAWSDWIELYNPTDAAVSFLGLYLTDEDDEPLQSALPADGEIAPGGYALFWADGNPSQGDDHTTFKLSGTGELVGLYFVAEGSDPVAVDVVEYGAQVADVSAARIPDGSVAWAEATPTPGATNGQ